MALLKLTIIEVAGTPEELGRAYGAACGERVRDFVAQRQRAAKVYLRERGIRDAEMILDLGRRCREQLKSWDHEGWIEQAAVWCTPSRDISIGYTVSLLPMMGYCWRQRLMIKRSRSGIRGMGDCLSHLKGTPVRLVRLHGSPTARLWCLGQPTKRLVFGMWRLGSWSTS